MKYRATRSLSRTQRRLINRTKQEAGRKLLGLELSPGNLVFSQADGSPLQPDSITQAFTRLARSIGRHRVHFHDLQHTHTTLMLKQGVHLEVVSERLGHSTVAVRLDTYSHVLPGLQEGVAQRQEGVAQRFEEGLQMRPVEVPVETVG